MQALSGKASDGGYARWHFVMFMMVLAYGLFNMMFGEIVPAGGGFGWDGVTYADITKNLPSLIATGHMTGYYAQRVLPSIVVRMGLMVAGLDFSNINIIRAFEIYNLVLSLVTVVAWKAIADHLCLRLGSRWIGFGAIFVNFLATKLMAYVPVTTDITAVLINVLLQLCYLKRWPVALLLVTIAGSFVWQITGLCGAALMIFMEARFPVAEGEERRVDIPGLNRRRIFYAWATVLIVCVALYVVMQCSLSIEMRGENNIRRLEELITGFPSLLLVIAAIIVLLGPLRKLRLMPGILLKINVRLVILAALCIVIPRLIVDRISNPALPNPNGFFQVFEWLVFPLNGEGKFLLPLVSPTLLWGPGFLLVVLLWRKIAAELRRLGPGVTMVVLINLPLILVTEARYILAAWPFVVVALVLALEKFNLDRSFYIAFASLSVLFAQFWLHINYRPWTGGDYDYNTLLAFPKQLLFMHTGPWMSLTMFLVQLPVVLLSALWLHRVTRASR